jgi:hypothetical protein
MKIKQRPRSEHAKTTRSRGRLAQLNKANRSMRRHYGIPVNLTYVDVLETLYGR